jgi:hypothetical protein
MPTKTKVKISRKLRKVIKSAPCSSKTLTTTRVRQDGKLSNKQKQSVTVNLAAPACQRKVRTTLQDGAFKHVKDPIARRQLIDQKIKSLRRMMGKKQKRRKRPRRAFVTPEEAASVSMGRSINYGALRPEVQAVINAQNMMARQPLAADTYSSHLHNTINVPAPQPLVVQLPGGQPVFEGAGPTVVSAAEGAAMGYSPGGAGGGLSTATVVPV